MAGHGMTGARNAAGYIYAGRWSRGRAARAARGRVCGRGWWSGSRQRPAGACACRGERSDGWSGHVPGAPWKWTLPRSYIKI